MEVIGTYHFERRIVERTISYRDDVMISFASAVCLMKKKKLHPRRGTKPDTFKVSYGWHTFVFAKDSGKFIIITYYRSW